LKDECKKPNSDAATFVQKLNDYFGHDNDFIPIKNAPNQFGVNHYAGKVKYIVKDFLSTNRDNVSKNIIECLQRSEDNFISDLFLTLPLPNGSYSKYYKIFLPYIYLF
jgi:myosin heavy subunit